MTQQTRKLETITMGAWLTDYQRADPRELHTLPAERIASIVCLSMNDMRSVGWSRVGVARVQIEIDPLDKMVGQKVDALKAQLAKDMAESEARQNMLRAKISQLEAIEWNGAAL